MDDLVAFVRQQLDTEERIATKAKAMRYDQPTDAPWERERLIADQVGGNSRAIAVHRMIAIFAHPDRVLAEVKAKRRILDWMVDCETKALDNNWWNLDVENAAKALAQPYAGQPGWREEWRP